MNVNRFLLVVLFLGVITPLFCTNPANVALFQAVKNGSVSGVEKIIANRAMSNVSFNARDGNTWNTPLIYAVKRESSSPALIETLIAAGANPHYAARQQYSVLTHAALAAAENRNLAALLDALLQQVKDFTDTEIATTLAILASPSNSSLEHLKKVMEKLTQYKQNQTTK